MDKELQYEQGTRAEATEHDVNGVGVFLEPIELSLLLECKNFEQGAE